MRVSSASVFYPSARSTATGANYQMLNLELTRCSDVDGLWYVPVSGAPYSWRAWYARSRSQAAVARWRRRATCARAAPRACPRWRLRCLWVGLVYLISKCESFI